MNKIVELPDMDRSAIDADLAVLSAAKGEWARCPIPDRIAILRAISDATMAQAKAWVDLATQAKMIPKGSPLAGEEWLSGPYALISMCNGLIATLERMEGKRFLRPLSRRRLPTGQVALRVMPGSFWDRLLLSGIRAEVWMQRGVTPDHIPAASAYDVPVAERRGAVALVLGAGNINAISPLDALHKLFIENEVVLLKMNPVNDYLTGVLTAALGPLIACDALRITRGDGAIGAWLCTHPLVEAIHITGAGATHDLIVWGAGDEGAQRRRDNRPLNPRRITSELGAVCPTIVVAGPWSPADIRFQAENIATQKLHNSGFNCVAMQALILPQGWDGTVALMDEVAQVMARAGTRPAYYAGAESRLAAFAEAGASRQIARGAGAPDCLLADLDAQDSPSLRQSEVFAPAFATKTLPAPDAETYLRAAIRFANDGLYGTLGANIIIHPATIRALGQRRFDEIIADLRYGTIAVNGWAGIAFTLHSCPWGGYPGATLQSSGSGIGTTHNSLMLEHVERTVITAPWRPFPRSLLTRNPSLLPRPPWFITHTRAHIVGRLLTAMAHKPSWRILPKLMINALRG